MYPITINYGQPCWEAEWWAAEKTTTLFGWQTSRQFTVDLSTIVVSGLTGGGATTTEEAWVPARNTLLMVLGAIYACHPDVNADGIAIGYMLNDNFVYGDNGYVHHQLTSTLLGLALSRPLQVFHPAQGKEKSGLISLLRRQEVYQFTTSCWNAKLKGDRLVECQKCGNCVEKLREEEASIGRESVDEIR